MKNGLLVCAGSGEYKNIGDYIQSVAQEQFLENICCYVEREELSDFNYEERINLIMNAWFMWNPTKFPPSSVINPLFISFHIVPRVSHQLLRPEVISYLKKYEPIGARDTNTKNLLESYGVKSYFSGCLTLTLGRKYKSSIHSNNVCFVDPYYELGGKSGLGKLDSVVRAFMLLVKHWRKVAKLFTHFVPEFHSRLSKVSKSFDKMLWCASFYESYSKIFDDDIIFNAEYVTHKVKQSDFSDHKAKMDYAKDLISKYSKSRMVITSRIHCALPCLAVETPVIFVLSEKLEGDSVRSSGRFGGLIELFYTLKFANGIEFLDEEFKTLVSKKIGITTEFKNKDNYKIIRDELEKKVENFVREFCS